MSINTAIAMRSMLQSEILELITLDDVLSRLMEYPHKDFYARMAHNIPRQDTGETNNACGGRHTMSIKWESGCYKLCYSGPWVNENLKKGPKGLDELQATIAHEMQHILLLHIPRNIKMLLDISDETSRRVFTKCCGLAIDAAANAPIRHEYKDFEAQPDEWIFHESLGLPEGLPYEWIIHYFLNPTTPIATIHGGDGQPRTDRASQIGKNIRLGLQIEDLIIQHLLRLANHDGWVNLEDINSEKLESDILNMTNSTKEIVERTVNEHLRACGRLPQEMEQYIQNLIRRPEISWLQELRNVNATYKKQTPIRSMRRPHRKRSMLQSCLYPGKRKSTLWKIWLLYDQSGSMSSKYCADGMSEMQALQKLDPDIEIHYMAFDTEPGEVHKITAQTKIDFTRERHGGTDFNEALKIIQYYEKRQMVDIVFIFTDGEANAPLLTSRPKHTPVVWCLTPHGVHPSPGFGRVIRMR